MQVIPESLFFTQTTAQHPELMVWSPLSIRATAEPQSPCVWYEQSPTGGPFGLQFDAPTEIPSLHPGELFS